MTPNRRTLLLAAAAALAAGPACAAQPPKMTVYKTPWCGCCGGWVKHLQANSFAVEVVELEDLAPIRDKHGVPFELSSCHTGVANGFVFEGHVPAADVVRFLKEKPKALGLTVPGMVVGSPGMEAPDGRTEPYDTLLLLEGGKTKLFARHGA